MSGYSEEVLSGTGNLTIERLDEGEYRILIVGVSDLYAQRDNYHVLISAVGGGTPVTINWMIASDNSIRVESSKPWVNFSNTSCPENECPQYCSYIENVGFYRYVDSVFSIVIYKV
jgi:hypothetical protein